MQIPQIILDAEKHLEEVIVTCRDPQDVLGYVREYAYSAQILHPEYHDGMTLPEVKSMIDEAIRKYKENYE